MARACAAARFAQLRSPFHAVVAVFWTTKRNACETPPGQRCWPEGDAVIAPGHANNF
jgi:hypothetical protein